MTTYWLQHVVLDDTIHDDVLVSIADGRFTHVGPRAARPDVAAFATALRGLTLPGLANCHSHAFHRALRARAQASAATDVGSFWTWREQMYRIAALLQPQSYQRLATAVFREMAATGITSVGEFHYVHHRADGSPYPAEDGGPNAMGLALLRAAQDVGIRITLLDTCYLAAGPGRPVEGVQRRFSDGSVDGWVRRVDQLLDRSSDTVRIGAAIHSVRAVSPHAQGVVAQWATTHGAPLHAHVSEQTGENDASLRAYGRTPTQVLQDAGALGPRSTLVHLTHPTDADVARVGGTGSHVCLCPTTERDLGDGIGPADRLRAGGSSLTLGSDSHAVVDLFEEMRALEMHERLATRRRAIFDATSLVRTATVDGHVSLGFADAGRIAVGQRADLVTVSLSSQRTAGCATSLETLVFAATAADVVHVVCDGRVVHRASDAPMVARQLHTAVTAATAVPETAEHRT